MAHVKWSCEDGYAVSRAEGRVLWTGAVDDGASVATCLSVPNSDDAVLLLDCDRRPMGVEAWHPFENVLRVGPDGQVRWRAKLIPNETAWKCWTSVEWREGRLSAHTASWAATLDADTGKLLGTTFTK